MRRPPAHGAPSLHGFLTRDGTAPEEFLAAARREARGYGVELLTDTADAVALDDDTDLGFRVTLAGGRMLRAQRVVATTGRADELPDIEGVAERWGRDVLHCPFCHGRCGTGPSPSSLAMPAAHLATDGGGRPSVPGMWAVGNLADLTVQVLDAAEPGSRAAIGINGELVLEDARAAARWAGG